MAAKPDPRAADAGPRERQRERDTPEYHRVVKVLGNPLQHLARSNRSLAPEPREKCPDPRLIAHVVFAKDSDEEIGRASCRERV